MQNKKLYGLIRTRYETLEAFAEVMGFSLPTLSQKLNGKSPWRLPEMQLVCRKLEIPLSEMHEFFLPEEVKKTKPEET